MNQSTDALLLDHPNRLITSMQNIIRSFKKLSSPMPISELLLQLEEATTPVSLTKIMNRLQNALWKLSVKEQTMLRKLVVNALSKHVLQGTSQDIRIEAAGWLRLFVQAGLVTQPEDIFVTLVTAIIQVAGSDDTEKLSEQQAYLKMIFDCFWPFRHPYPAYSWQVFPANEVFYPLAPLFDHADAALQDALMGIFAELPSLDDKEILEHLLPVALQWANHADAERRRRVTNILARINQLNAQETLRRLQSDSDPVVRASAKSAAGYAKRA